MPPLRKRRRDEVPADEFRKDLIIQAILNLVEAQLTEKPGAYEPNGTQF